MTDDLPIVDISFLSGPYDDPLVMRLSGELDITSATDVRCALIAALEHPRSVVIDLSGLTFCDCAGIRIFAEISDRCAVGGRSFRLAAPPRIVYRTLTLLRVGDQLAIYATVDAAIAADDRQRIGRAAEQPPTAIPNGRPGVPGTRLSHGQ
jgi:anti-anti-sigma factor